MTAEMREKTDEGVRAMGLSNVEVRGGFAETLPVDDGFADVIISNGVVNLCPDKRAVFREMLRVLKPGGRLQIGDILVHREVPQDSKDDIALWSG
jgi:ubiquinone/menaquinone biosynthesis C-methylase UbiE